MGKRVQSIRNLKDRLGPVMYSAYRSYDAQKQRCYNPKNKDYARYGGRGIGVEYSRSDFMKWYGEMYQINPCESPVVGRIDHDSNYKFGNIEIQSSYMNSVETHSRRSRYNYGTAKRKKIGLFSLRSDECIATFPSLNKCAIEFGVRPATLKRSIVGESSPMNKKYSWYFGFVE